MALDYLEEEGEGRDGTEKAFQQSLSILREMQNHSSIALSYVTLLKEIQEYQGTGQSRSPFNLIPSRSRSDDFTFESGDIFTQGDENIDFTFDNLFMDLSRPDTSLNQFDSQELCLESWNIMAVDSHVAQRSMS